MLATSQRRVTPENTPSTTIDAMVSWMARSDTRIRVSALRLAEALEAGEAAPHRGEELVAAVAEVERDGDAGLGEAGPDRVVRRVAERAGRAVAPGYRRRPHVHDAGAECDDAIDLGERGLGVGERDHRRRDDAARGRSPSRHRATG